MSKLSKIFIFVFRIYIFQEEMYQYFLTQLTFAVIPAIYLLIYRLIPLIKIHLEDYEIKILLRNARFELHFLFYPMFDEYSPECFPLSCTEKDLY